MELTPIAYIHTDFPDKFGIPRQSGLADSLEGRIVFEPQYRNREALRGLEGFEYIWLLWGFSANRHTTGSWQPTVRPPKLGGNTRMGVFATRSPYRPNPIGLSSVKLSGIEDCATEGRVIKVLGADLMDGTPIYDIKPYLPYADSHPGARAGFTDEIDYHKLTVNIPSDILPEDAAAAPKIREVLSLDPRPSYQDDPQKIYGLSLCGYEIKFRVDSDNLYVISLHNIPLRDSGPKQ